MALAQTLHQKKFPAYVITPGADKLYYVQVGPHADTLSATNARHDLQANGFNSIVKRWSSPIVGQCDRFQPLPTIGRLAQNSFSTRRHSGAIVNLQSQVDCGAAFLSFFCSNIL
jgi:hypothetical protein